MHPTRWLVALSKRELTFCKQILIGFELIHLIKQNPKHRNIPVLVISANIISEDEVRIGELFDSFLRKPVTSHELTESLEEYLQSEQHSGKVRGVSNFSLSEQDHEFLKNVVQR